MTNYSFKALVAVINHPLGGQFVIQGQLGAGQVTVDNMTDHTAIDMSADGNAMLSAIVGDNGMVTFECQQTSQLHIYFLNCWNLTNAALQNGDATGANAMTATLRNTIDGTSHRCKGGGFGKIPPKPYAAQGQKITWALPFGDVQNLTA